MPKAISVDLRQRVLAAYDAGMRPVDVIRQFQVKAWWFYHLLRQRTERGSIEPKPRSGGPKPKLAGKEEALRKCVEQQPDITLEELRERLQLQVSLTTVHRALEQLHLSFKKKHARQRTASA